jgi:hypothetical protein
LILCSLSILRTALACAADEVEVVAFSGFLADTHAVTVLPDIALLAGDAMRPIVNLPVRAADAVKNPVFFFLSKLFESQLLALYL